MTSPSDKARHFRGLHIAHDPVILHNIWDAGSAKAVARAGATAIATGSWSVAAAQGYPDGEALPLDEALAVYRRIADSVDLPITVDFEGGYASDPDAVAHNVSRLMSIGVAGINFEDQVARLRAVRRAVDASGIPAFINARTDVFLKAPPDADPAALLGEVRARAAAYAKVGADGFFVPGLSDKTMIADLCATTSLPINVMMAGDAATVRDLAARGVSWISFGPAPYIGMVTALETTAGIVLQAERAK